MDAQWFRDHFWLDAETFSVPRDWKRMIHHSRDADPLDVDLERTDKLVRIRAAPVTQTDADVDAQWEERVEYYDESTEIRHTILEIPEGAWYVLLPYKRKNHKDNPFRDALRKSGKDIGRGEGKSKSKVILCEPCHLLALCCLMVCGIRPRKDDMPFTRDQNVRHVVQNNLAWARPSLIVYRNLGLPGSYLVIHKNQTYHLFMERNSAAAFIAKLLDNKITQESAQMRITRAVDEGTPEIDEAVAVYKF